MKTTLALLFSLAFAQPGFSQTGDAPPVNAAELLKALQQIKDINAKGIATRRDAALQQVLAASATGEKAVALWKEAVKTVKFKGAKMEGTKMRDWSEEEGSALNDKLCQEAVRRQLLWTALTLKRAGGAEVSELLPNIIEFVKQVQAGIDAADHFKEQLDKARARDTKSPGARKVIEEDSLVRRVHDEIMRLSVRDSPVARLLQIEEIIDMAGGVKSKKGNAPNVAWENTPGNLNGIYGTIILPEFRAKKDPRLLEYWDMILKRRTEEMADRTLEVELHEWTTERRPSLLWDRAQDVMLLGYENKAILEMFNVVKAFPNHPNAANWILALQGILDPSTGEARVAPAPAAAPAPTRAGTIEPPTRVPSATILPPTAPAPAR